MIFGIVVVIAALAVAAKFWFVPAFIKHRIKQTVQQTLRAELLVKDVIYHPPLSAELRSVRLVDYEGRELLAIKTLRATLKDLSGSAEPVRLSSLQVQGAVVRRVRHWRQLLRPGSGEKLWHRIVIEKLMLRDFTIEADTPGRTIIGTIDLAGEGERAGRTYRFSAVSRGGLLGRQRLAGRLDIDSMFLHIPQLHIEREIDTQLLAALPPAMRKTAADCSAAAAATVLGKDLTIPLNKPLKDWPSATLMLHDGRLNVPIGEYPLPLVRLTGVGKIGPTGLSIPSITGRCLGGTAEISNLTVTWSEGPRYRAELVRLRDAELSRIPVENHQKQLKGLLRLDCSLQGRGGLETLVAVGRAELHRADLWPLPLFRQISRAVGRLNPFQISHAQAEFQLADEIVQLGPASLDSMVMAMKVQGLIYLDNRVDLNVSAKLLPQTQTVLDELLGPLDKAIGSSLVGLHITGTLDEPVITPVPLEGFFEPINEALKRLKLKHKLPLPIPGLPELKIPLPPKR